MRDIIFANGEFYHIFNRGNNKRPIFLSDRDLLRFLTSMYEFNSQEPIGSIYEKSFHKKELGSSASKPTPKSKRLVDFVCFCLNSNHYHLLIKQLADDGIQKFMHRLGTGFTKYFNQKYKNSGSLFQGRFKAIHVDSNEYLLHLSVYINLNNQIHKLGSSASKLSKSSWSEYMNHKKGQHLSGDLCNKDIILSQFDTPQKYKQFAEEARLIINEHKDLGKSLKLELGSSASKWLGR